MSGLRQFKDAPALHNAPAPGADEDIFPADFSLPEGEGGLYKLVAYAVLSTPSALNLAQRRKTGNTKATGTITVVAGADLADGDNFTLNDGANPAVVFEYDDDDSIAGDYPIAFTAARDARHIRDITLDAIRAAIAAEDLDMAAEADPSNPAKILLTTATDAVEANEAILEDVADAGFVVDGMDGWDEDGEALFALTPSLEDDELPAEQCVRLEGVVVAGYQYNLQLAADGDIPLLAVGYQKL